MNSLCLATLGRFEEAEAAERTAIECGGLGDGTLASLIDACRLRGRHDRALRIAERLARKDSENFAWLLVASLHATGALGEARDLAREVLETHDICPRKSLSAAYLHAVTGNRAALAATLDLYEGSWDAFMAHDRARIHAVANQVDEAIR